MRRKPGALVPLERAICETAADLHASGIEDFHGYELAKRLSDIADCRLLTAYGTLYRALGRLEQMGMLTSRWGRSGDPGARESSRPPVMPNSPPRGESFAARASACRRSAENRACPETPGFRIAPCCNHRRSRARVDQPLHQPGMPDGLRDARRLEIESDLWGIDPRSRPASDAAVAYQIALRLLRGLPDDVLWRMEIGGPGRDRGAARTGLWLTAIVAPIVMLCNVAAAGDGSSGIADAAVTHALRRCATSASATAAPAATTPGLC